MQRNEKDGIQWLEFEQLKECSRIKQGIFLRQGGKSPQPFNSFNLGTRVGDAPENVAYHLEKVSTLLRIPQLRWVEQVHGKNCMLLSDPKMASHAIAADALITTLSDVGLMIHHADCQAAIIYDPVRQVIANVHSGWRGSVHNIYGEVIRLMQTAYQCHPSNLLVCISPSLGPQDAEFVNYREEGLLPPTFVESRLEQPSDKESVISTHIEEEKVPLKWILEPASSVPVIPSLPGGALKREFQIAKKESTQKNPFLAFEQEVQHQGLNHTPMATLYTPLHIHLSGGLAQNTLISDGTEGITWLQTLPNEPLPPSSLEKFSLLYAIQIESKNGKIFWVEPKFSSAVPDYLNQIAERILKQMVFKEEKRLVIQSGEIELLFTLPNNTTNIILNN